MPHFRPPQITAERIILFREYCHGLVVGSDDLEKTMVYRHNDGLYETVRRSDDHEISTLSTEFPALSPLAKIYASPHILAHNSNTDLYGERPDITIIDTRKFYNENCCCMLMHQEMDDVGPVRVYKNALRNAITTCFMSPGREELRIQKRFRMEFPSEKTASETYEWPNMSWRRPKSWSPPII